MEFNTWWFSPKWFLLFSVCDDSYIALSHGYNGGTAAAVQPSFRPGNPALCGSRPLVTPYNCRLGDLLCLFVCAVFVCYFVSVCICVICVFFVFFSFTAFSFSTLILLVGSFTCKNHLPYNVYCVGGDVKHCTIQSNLAQSFDQSVTYCMLPAYLFCTVDGVLQKRTYLPVALLYCLSCYWTDPTALKHKMVFVMNFSVSIINYLTAANHSVQCLYKYFCALLIRKYRCCWSWWLEWCWCCIPCKNCHAITPRLSVLWWHALRIFLVLALKSICVEITGGKSKTYDTRFYFKLN